MLRWHLHGKHTHPFLHNFIAKFCKFEMTLLFRNFHLHSPARTIRAYSHSFYSVPQQQRSPAACISLCGITIWTHVLWRSGWLCVGCMDWPCKHTLNTFTQCSYICINNVGAIARSNIYRFPPNTTHTLDQQILPLLLADSMKRTNHSFALVLSDEQPVESIALFAWCAIVVWCTSYKTIAGARSADDCSSARNQKLISFTVVCQTTDRVLVVLLISMHFMSINWPAI